MKDLIIKINLAEQKLYFNENSIKLGKTLISAEEYTEENNGKRCLDIIYDNNQDLYDEALEIINFRNISGLEEALRVRVHEHKNDAVQIIGNYNSKILKTPTKLREKLQKHLDESQKNPPETPTSILDLP